MRNMMGKFAKISLISLINFNTYANDASVTNIINKINNDMRETRIKEGFNPDGGVVLVSSSQIRVPDSLKIQWDKERVEQKNKGYYSMYSERAKELIQLKDLVQFKYDASLINKDKNSSIFRRSLDEIALAYDFSPINENYISKVYGFAACNTFKDGWTGVVEFFESEELGVCAYTENNVVLTHQSAKVDKNIVRYDINEKVSIFRVEGNKDSGYLYRIDWFDNKFFRTLECAKKHYSLENSSSLTLLAIQVDKN